MIENKCMRDSRSKTGYLISSMQNGAVELQGGTHPSVSSFSHTAVDVNHTTQMKMESRKYQDRYQRLLW